MSLTTFSLSLEQLPRVSKSFSSRVRGRFPTATARLTAVRNFEWFPDLSHVAYCIECHAENRLRYSSKAGPRAELPTAGCTNIFRSITSMMRPRAKLNENHSERLEHGDTAVFHSRAQINLHLWTATLSGQKFEPLHHACGLRCIRPGYIASTSEL